MDENTHQIKEPSTKLEEFTIDLYENFTGYLVNRDPEALAIYEQVIRFLDKKQDEFLATEHEMTPDLTPQELAKMHENAKSGV